MKKTAYKEEIQLKTFTVATNLKPWIPRPRHDWQPPLRDSANIAPS